MCRKEEILLFKYNENSYKKFKKLAKIEFKK